MAGLKARLFRNDHQPQRPVFSGPETNVPGPYSSAPVIAATLDCRSGYVLITYTGRDPARMPPSPATPRVRFPTAERRKRDVQQQRSSKQ
jgi:hypothetical protein